MGSQLVRVASLTAAAFVWAGCASADQDAARQVAEAAPPNPDLLAAYRAVADAIRFYSPSGFGHPSRPLDGQQYCDVLAELIGRYLRHGMQLEDALDRARLTPVFLVELVDDTVQVTYIGPEPSKDRRRSWRSPLPKGDG